MRALAKWVSNYLARSHWLRLVRLHGESGARQRMVRTLARQHALLHYGRRYGTLTPEEQLMCVGVAEYVMPKVLASFDVIPPNDGRSS